MEEWVRCLRCEKTYNRDLNPNFCPRCKFPLWKTIKNKEKGEIKNE